MSLVAGRLEGLGLVIFPVASGEVRCLVSLAEKQVGRAGSCPLFQVMLDEQEVCIRYSFSGRRKGNPFHFVNRLFHSHHTHQRSRRYRKSEKSGKEKEEASRWDLPSRRQAALRGDCRGVLTGLLPAATLGLTL